MKKTRSESSFSNGYISVDMVDLEHNGKSYQYSTVSTGDGVLVVPAMQTDSGMKFALVQQYRTHLDGPSIEFPKGLIEPGETPSDAALRELKEETGLEPLGMTPFGVLTPNARSPDKLHVYLAVIDSSKEATPLQLSEFEQACGLELKLVTADELLLLISKNEILDGQTLAGLLLVMLKTGSAAKYVEQIGG